MNELPLPASHRPHGVLMALGAEGGDDWPAAVRVRLRLDLHRVVHVPWPRLSPTLLDTLAPRAVLTPLLAARFDAVEAAGRLAELGFDGRLVVVTDSALPDMRLVQRELVQAGRGIAVDLLICP